jgi:hypothetical protein
MANEAGRREALRAREASLAEGRRQARDMAIRRQAEPKDAEVRLDDATSGDEHGGDGGVSTTPVYRER